MSWTSILLFVKKYWKVIAGAALAVVLWLVLTTLYDRIWQQGYDAKTAEIDALTVERNEQVAGLNYRSNAATFELGVGHLAMLEWHDTHTANLLKELEKDVASYDPERCRLPVGLVRLHDAAASASELSGISYGSGLPHDADTEFDCARAFDVVIRNYGRALKWKDTVDQWQRWYVKNKSLFDEFEKARQ